MSDPHTKWLPNDEQRAVLLALQAECAKEHTVITFCNKFVPFTRSKFDQILDVLDDKKADSYFDRLSETARVRLFDELKFILGEIPLKRLQLARVKEVKIFPTTKINALDIAIREVKSKPGPERLIVNLGPTGAGKTMTCNHLMKTVNARFVEVRDIWRSSKRAKVPLFDVCKAVGLRNPSNNVATAQDQLIAWLGEQNIVVVFDEAEYFSAPSLNLLKLLLNRTRILPVIFAVPEEYDKWFKFWPNEASQIARRTHAIIDNSILDPRDVALFFPPGQFAAEKEALEILVEKASKFGHFSLVHRVAERLENIKAATCGGNNSDLSAAITAAKRQMMRGV